MKVCLYLDRARTLRWHQWLAHALAEIPGCIITTQYSAQPQPLPKSLLRLLTVERLIYQIPPDNAIDSVDRVAVIDQHPPAQPYDIVINLTDDTLGLPIGLRVLTPYYNGALGEIGAIGVLLGAERARIDVYDSSHPGNTWSGHPALSDREVITRSLDNLLSVTTGLLLKAVRGTEQPTATDAPRLPNHPAANPAAQLYAVKGFVQKIGRHLEKIRRGDHRWFAAWRLNPRDTSNLLDRQHARFSVIKDDGHRFYADPFPFRHARGDYVFVEEFPFKIGRGIISVAKIENGRACTPVPILEEPHHLSYPYVFEHNGTIWMIPESGDANGIYLYRAARFPYEWVRECCLVPNLQGFDATLLLPTQSPDGRFWMFVCERLWNSSTWDILSLLHSDSLIGPWQRHANNPILIDSKLSRPAGAMFTYQGSYVRPAQDCSQGYGRTIQLCRVDTLTPTQFEQTRIATIECGTLGCHTYNNHHGLEVIDAFDRRVGREINATMTLETRAQTLLIAAG